MLRCFVFVAVLGPMSGQQIAPKVDRLLSQWNRSDGPGVAIGLVRDGELVFAKGYGMANLEYDIPITPKTVFDIASVSKQFGAMSIVLLADQGKLSLADSVRKHLPELPEFADRITLRHLLNHTSGVRDWPLTLGIGGWSFEDVISFDQIIRMAQYQTELNFEPGAEYTYSNTGYNLLAETVQRVSGKGYDEYTQEAMFRPLGMRDTHFHDDHRRIVKNRAYSYRSETEGYLKAVENLTALASSSLYTTVEDLAKWVANFETMKVGNNTVLGEMEARGVLNNGETIAYAMGQSRGMYRGLTTFRHGGSWGGFRTHLVRFPDQKAGVIVLSNVAEFNATKTANELADILLEDEVGPVEDPAERRREESRTPWKPTRTEMHEFVGSYYSRELETVYHVELRGEKLFVRHFRTGESEMVPTETGHFRVRGSIDVRFGRDESGRVQEMFLTRMPRVRNVRFERMDALR